MAKLYSVIIFLNIVFSVLIPVNAYSQENFSEEEFQIIRQRESNKLFLQQTLNYSDLSYFSPPYVDLGSPKEGYILSADISPRFVIGGSWMRFPIHIIPRYKVRIFKDDPEEGDVSLPVRTPSYMPGATIYFPFKQMQEETKNISYLSLSFFHHSNGQDGNEFTADEEINLYNGNFSTNYIEPAFHFRKRKSYKIVGDQPCSNPKNNYFDIFGKFGLEKHFLTSDELKGRYGDYRLNTNFGIIRVINYCDRINGKQYEDSYFREFDRIIFNSTFILGEREGKLNNLSKRINININYNWRIPSSPNTSLFAGVGYFGSDTYNIYFEQSYFYIHAGISLGFFVTPNLTAMKN